jgi:phage tail tape-measure protein
VARDLPLYINDYLLLLEGERQMFTKNCLYRSGSIFFLAGALAVASCAGGPLTTREKGAGIGALGGAAAGGLVGSAVGHPGAGAAIGGGLGLGAGALIGDQMQGREYRDRYYER